MAMTTKYVTVTGAGAKNGTDADNAWDFATMLSSQAAGDRILLQSGTYSIASDAVPTNAGTRTSPIVHLGCDANWNPISPTRTTPGGALATTGIPVIAMASTKQFNDKNFSIWRSVSFTSTFNGQVFVLGSDSLVDGCVFANASTGSSANVVATLNRTIVHNCDISLTGASGGSSAVYTQTGSKVINCRISSGTTSGRCVDIEYSGVCILGNLLYSGKSHGVYIYADVSACVAYNTMVLATSGGTSDGVHITTGNTTLNCVIGNLITDCTRYGLNGVASSNAVASIGNRIDRCTSGAYNSATDWLASTKWGDDVASITQANEYENAAAADFRLKSTSPAIGKGPWLLGDIGALQAAASGGGSAGPVVGCGFIRGANA